MLPNASDAYLETQVFTATPQRLRLMLIEGAIRRVNAAQLAVGEGNSLQANAEVGRCRDIVAELMSSIDTKQSPLNQQIFSIYLFLYSSLIEITMANDFGRLAGILRILEEERQTWREVCEKMPDRPAPDAASPSAEELAPSRVAESTFTAGYVPAPNLFQSRSAAFSLDA